jgi:hypothetical protein
VEGSNLGLIIVATRYSPLGTEENHAKPIRIAGLRLEIQTRDAPNRKQECYQLTESVGLRGVMHIKYIPGNGLLSTQY